MLLNEKEIARIFGIKPRNWQRALERNLAKGLRPQGTSLAIADYPELHLLSFFLTKEAGEQWHTGQRLESRIGDGAVLVEHGRWNDRVDYLTLIGPDPDHLAAIRDRYNIGDVIPPWSLFPEYDAESGFWKQGGEFWIADVFRPFLTGMGAEARQRYLDRWNASPPWREFVEFICGAA